ncbi:MAG: hypothetical protein ACK5PR_03260 [bacterium]|jgi:hypothetical protein
MKRKVKFQEGGEVGSGMTAAERRRANIERLNARRSVAEFNRREQAGQLNERTMQRAGGTPVTSEVADFNRRMQSGQLDADTMRRMGGTPSGSADALRSGAGMAPSAGGSAMSRMAPRAGGILGLLGLAPLALEAYRAVRDRERPQEDLDIAEAYRTGRDVREIQAQRAAREGRGVFPGETPETTPSPAPEATPAPTSQSTPARSQPTRRAAAPARRESTSADDLNAMVLRLQSGVAPQTETERRLADRMGIAYRKGGLVKPKASVKKMKTGGKVAPKKMMKGGITSKPKAKPAKYAKGGMTKGRK